MTDEQAAAVYDEYANGFDTAYYLGLNSGLNIAESIMFKVLNEVEIESGTRKILSAVLCKFLDAISICLAKSDKDADAIFERICEDCKDAMQK